MSAAAVLSRYVRDGVESLRMRLVPAPTSKDTGMALVRLCREVSEGPWSVESGGAALRTGPGPAAGEGVYRCAMEVGGGPAWAVVDGPLVAVGCVPGRADWIACAIASVLSDGIGGGGRHGSC